MNPDINSGGNNAPYSYPTPPPAPKKKKMTPAKWVAIFVPIGVVLLILITFLMIKGITNIINHAFDQVVETEQYELALDYLTSSDQFRQIETEDTTVTMSEWLFSGGREKKYEFTFKTEKATYIIVVRDDGAGLYVSEEECQYQKQFTDTRQRTLVCV